MTWELKDDRPIYLQLMDHVKRQIIAGLYRAGDKLPSVRDLAVDAAVNPNTMQKALGELEREGFLYSQRTSGRFITEDESMIREAKEALAMEQIHEFIEKMEAIGYRRDEIVELLQKVTEEAGQ